LGVVAEVKDLYDGGVLTITATTDVVVVVGVVGLFGWFVLELF